MGLLSMSVVLKPQRFKDGGVLPADQITARLVSHIELLSPLSDFAIAFSYLRLGIPS